MSREVRSTSTTGGEKGVKLERFDLVPPFALTQLARHYGKGARKYADHQWRKGYEPGKSIAALMRHLTAYEMGIDYDACESDPEGCRMTDLNDNPIDWAEPGKVCFNHTGSHHLDAVMWNSFTLREFAEYHSEMDDRYIYGKGVFNE